MRSYYRFTIVLIAFVFTVDIHCSFSQLYINEFSASNSGIIEDPDYHDDPDWIEIYNSGSNTLNLIGYYLTDNIGNPDKWRIVDDIYIGPESYILFWADGRDHENHTGFKLSAAGEEIGLFDPELDLIDTLTYAAQKADVSYGRDINNQEQWGYYPEPTPGAANTTQQFPGIVFTAPEFIPAGGLYNSGLSVELFSYMGGTIRYTLDGSEPGPDSPEFTSSIPISSTTIIRARIYSNGLIPGPVVTSSYFINEGFEERNLPVISIATDPGNFWDPQTGIYVQDFKPDWEIPVNIEMFEIDGSDRAAFNERAGIKVNGLYSWQLPQKMLGVYFRNRYGSGSLSYPLILNTYRSGYKTFALRASGSDWSYTLFRDILGQQATKLNTDLDISASRPCIVYVNGQYMGIHNIREKIETDYIEQNHDMEGGTFDMVENQDYPEAGSLDQYNELINLFSRNLSIQSNFDVVAREMDIENFTDLVITEMAVGNTSIDHNVMAWKPKGSGKWNWIVMDLDRGFFNPSSNLISFYLNQDAWPFSNLFDNQEYVQYFGKRLADQLYTTFHPQRMIAMIDEHKSAIEAEIPRHVDRWLGATSSYGDAIPSVDYWYGEVDDLKSFVQVRPNALLSDLESYGFSGTANLTLSIVPSNAGHLSINGLKIPAPDVTGPYLRDVSSQITAIEKPGYEFKGWISAEKKIIIPKGSTWKYLDDGSDQGTAWTDTSFNDASWSSGPAQLGYGEGDESTVISYGSNPQQKYMTSYFRHAFHLTPSDLNASTFMVSLLRDDGAIVYLNGIQIICDNVGGENINYLTPASSAVSGQSESAFYSFTFDKALLKPGENTLAVEVHQSAAASSDLSFDLEMSAYVKNTSAYVSTNRNYPISLTGDLGLCAVFEETEVCVIPELISEDMLLYESCSPYYVQGDIIIQNDATLTVEAGVEIYMLPETSIFVKGKIEANGTENERIIFKINPAYSNESWGAINFENTDEPSDLSYITIEDASRGPIPVRVGAINAFYADLNMDNMIIENIYDNPISARYSDIVLTNSKLHSEVTGDLINVKYGKARIENCLFTGNNKVDADAIDYDDVEGGIIRNCKIYNCLGVNNDAIDLGEKATNVIIDSVVVYNVFDKGVSIGQRSTAEIRNSVFINCNMGVGAKDSSKVIIDHCVFYSTAYPVKCYEKNAGSAGGNANVTNSILSNSSEKTYLADSKSTIQISYSLSDNDSLPDNSTNLWANPEFINPSFYDFGLLNRSPCISAGYNNGTRSDLGVDIHDIETEPSVMISSVYINSLNTNYPEFLSLYNPASHTVDISGYEITKGITCTIPPGYLLEPGSKIYLSDQVSSIAWSDIADPVIEWSAGRLSNNGEQIQLQDANGIVVDYIRYDKDGGWPSGAFVNGDIMNLISYNLDNHFPESWTTASIEQLFSKEPPDNTDIVHYLKIYPNPSMGLVHIISNRNVSDNIKIYSIMGLLLDEIEPDDEGHTTVDLSVYDQHMLLIRMGEIVKQVLLVK